MAALVLNYNPNARYDHGNNAAGAGRVSTQDLLVEGAPTRTGLRTDGSMWSCDLRVGFNAAGVARDNIGPNAAGQLRSVNST